MSKDNKGESTAFKAGQATAVAVTGGLGILGRGTIWLTRGIANTTTAAGRGIAAEYKRQQAEGFNKK